MSGTMADFRDTGSGGLEVMDGGMWRSVPDRAAQELRALLAERDTAHAQCRNLGQQLAKAGEERNEANGRANAHWTGLCQYKTAVARACEHLERREARLARLVLEAALSPADTTAGAGADISVPHDLLLALWCYGNLRPVENVVYHPGSHRQCLDAADKLIATAAQDRLTAHAPFTPVTPASHTTVAPPAAPDAGREAEDQTVGGVTWHSSDEDSGPDCGTSIYLAPNDRLYFGEISRSLFEEHSGDEYFKDDFGHFLVRYAPNETTLIAKAVETHIAQEFMEWLAPLVRRAALTPSDGWRPIESAPKDQEIWVYAPPREGLDAIQCRCAWHPDGGFCVDELRFVTHWRPLPPPPALDTEGGA